MLHAVVEHRGPRMVLVHGFTQTLRSWDEIAFLMGHRFRIVRVDLPGHGGSADVRLDFAGTADAIGDVGQRAVYVGYSMGGRLCLQLALDRPELVEALVLIGSSPGIPDRGARLARQRSDEQLAREIEQVGTARFLDKWLSQPLFRNFVPTATDLESRRANSPAGLAAALRLLGTGVQEPLWDRLVKLEVPVLLLVGAYDPEYSLIADRMAGSIGGQTMVAHVPNAGHAAHLEQPKPACRIIWSFLASHNLAPRA